jgi:hypothetical protein
VAVRNRETGRIVSRAVDAKSGRQAAESLFQTRVRFTKFGLGIQARQVRNY